MRCKAFFLLMATSFFAMGGNDSFAVDLWPDTGQQICYDDAGTVITCGSTFVGQDADYDGPARSYDVASDPGTLIDETTGLQWINNDMVTGQSPMSYSSAELWIADLNSASYNGYSDWRMPTAKELATLVDASEQPWGGIGTSYGDELLVPPRTRLGDDNYTLAQDQTIFWSQTESPANQGFQMVVRFFKGAVNDGAGAPYPGGAPFDDAAFVRAVRSTTMSADGPYVSVGVGVIWDSNSGLMWQEATASTTVGNRFMWGTSSCVPGGSAGDQADGLCYCENLDLDGYSDWRLPSRNEMLSVINYGQIPTITSSLSDTVSYYYWTSTTGASFVEGTAYIDDAAVAVRFDRGFVLASALKKASNKAYVRCVRGSDFQVKVTHGANVTVSDAAEGINWVTFGNNLSVTYAADTNYSLEEVLVDGAPDSGFTPGVTSYTYTFANVTDNHVINASTAINTFTVTVNVGDGGVVTDVTDRDPNNHIDYVGPSNNIVTVDSGASRTFEVVANDHFSITEVFADSVAVAPGNDNKYNHTFPDITSDHSYSATFTENLKYLLDVKMMGAGSVESNPVGILCDSGVGTCSVEFYEGENVELTATALAGNTFTGWSGGGCSGTDTCNVTMDSAQTVTATFVADSGTYNLKVTMAGSGTGSVTSDPGNIDCTSATGGTCVANFSENTVVTLTAAKDPGNVFTGWSGGGCSGTLATCTVTMNQEIDVAAAFDPVPVVTPSNIFIFMPAILSGAVD